METISIIIPTQPGGQFLASCLSSVLKSSYRNLEVLLIDRGGYDERAAELLDGDERIRILADPGGHCSAAWNEGVRHAGGSMIALVDAKDMLGRMRLELQVNRLLKEPASGLSFCGMTFIDDDGGFLKGVHLTHTFDQKRFRAHLLHVNQIGSVSTVLLTRDILETVGEFDESLAHHAAYDMWLRIAGISQVDYLDLPLVLYRLASVLNGSMDEDEDPVEIRRILQKVDLRDIAQTLALAFQSEELFRLSLGVILSRRGAAKEACDNFQRVLDLNPGNPDVRFYLGNHYFNQQQHQDAVHWYTENLKLYPDHAETRNNLGVLLYRQGQLAGSRIEFQKARRIKQDYQHPVFNLQCLQAKTAIDALRITLAAAQITRNMTSPARVG